MNYLDQPNDLAAITALARSREEADHDCAAQRDRCGECLRKANLVAAKVPMLAAEIEDLRREVERLSAANAIIARRDAEIARLKAALSVEKEDGDDLRVDVARLRAELDAAKAESLGHENAAYGHRSDTQEARAEINEAIQQAHLILDHYAPPECTDRPTTLSSALTQIDGVMLATQRALSSARAALDKEREALASMCDEQAALAKRDRCHAEAGTLRQIASSVRARRAAEAKESQ